MPEGNVRTHKGDVVPSPGSGKTRLRGTQRLRRSLQPARETLVAPRTATRTAIAACGHSFRLLLGCAQSIGSISATTARLCWKEVVPGANLAALVTERARWRPQAAFLMKPICVY